jgi:peptidyl-tRNA hydrolase
MPVHPNPFDSAYAADLRSAQEDPWAMYYVVPTDLRLSFGQALAYGGAGAVACADQFRTHPRWQAAFATWQAQSYRKIVLRANPEQFARARAELAAAVVEAAGAVLLCLPPQRKSQCPVTLTDLAVFTDARRPVADPEPELGPALIYVVRAEVMKSMGKAMAQAGHAALMCADVFAEAYAPAWAAWRAQGRPGAARLASEDAWQRLKAEVDCVAVVDAGLTQLVPGTETVLALPPLADQTALVAALPRLV